MNGIHGKRRMKGIVYGNGDDLGWDLVCSPAYTKLF